jgi:hypothetical protein
MNFNKYVVVFVDYAQNRLFYGRNHQTMIANIPLSLTECLAPRELGELLDAAERDGRPVEDLVVFAVRELLERRRVSPPLKSAAASPAPVAA